MRCRILLPLVVAAIVLMSSFAFSDDGFYVIPVPKASSGTINVDSIHYKTPQTRYLSVPGNAFQPSDSSLSYYVQWASIYPLESFIGSAYIAPVYLPHGARIINIAAYICDYYTGLFAIIGLMEEDMTKEPSVEPTILREVNSSLFSTSGECKTITQTGTMAFPYVNNESNTYYLVAYNLHGGGTSGNYISLRWVRVEYTVTEPLP